WRFGPQKAIRQGDWSLVDWRDFDKKSSSGWQLFNLKQDIGQTKDLAAERPEQVAQLRQSWERWNEKNIEPLWHGGTTEDPTAPPEKPEIKVKK
ncbi:MAG TPA: hypothetical protein VHR66_21860, partial [Gemmataceae bacterium]|nr:hypothetical protein [Gemmataceae bacterium]